METVAFFGASGGVGLSALKHTLASGRNCIALCRNPAKLASILPPSAYPNLKIVQGDAHSFVSVSRCLQARPGLLVDKIVSTIGSVCRRVISILLYALSNLRREGSRGRPHIIVISSRGVSRFGRDTPLLMVPLYYLLKAPQEDKYMMEDLLISSSENFTIVRPSILVDKRETTKKVRAGIEDPKIGRESAAIGYTIAKADAGRWVAENLVFMQQNKYHNKITMITT
ncbi:hypothetical protein F4861DRAFT_538439 [Xylaria intraflava]|nr:hypothetical protein F4861DRAFT_538439 [Xylaria intraflava]